MTPNSFQLATTSALKQRLLMSLEWCSKGLYNPRVIDFMTRRQESSVRLIDKFAIETSLFLAIATRVDDPTCRATATAMGQRCADLLWNSETSALLTLRPELATPFGLAHSFLNEIGFSNACFHHLLEKLFLSGEVETTERASYRSIETQWVRQRLGFSINFDPQKAVMFSNIAAHGSGLRLSVVDLYSITHSLMYLTDFGRCGLPPSLAPTGVSKMIDAGLSWCVLSENLDVMTELLLANIAGRLPIRASHLFAWHMLCSVWDKSGFVASRSFEDHGIASSGDSINEMELFRRTYHTMHVLGILSAVCLTSGNDGALYSGELDNSQSLGLLADSLQYIATRPSLRGKHTLCINCAPTATISDTDLSAAIASSAALWSFRECDFFSLATLARSWIKANVPCSEILVSTVGNSILPLETLVAGNKSLNALLAEFREIRDIISPSWSS